ncbi:MAG: translation elongation factor Ts [Gemmatimonadota bacterium]|nr:translation elongation factor Ts [Gemmatimonadota bacterium]MDH3427431.1 translation elongation factor Ts [Gemmatimonadota bacterium]
MSTITAQSVKSLRDRTGAGMMDCKKALLEVDGDEEMAIDLLRKWGAAKAATRAERETREGMVCVASGDAGLGMVAVSSETDFVARNEEFQDFSARLATAVASSDLPDGEAMDGERLLNREAFASFAAELTDLRTKIGENISVYRAVRLQPSEGSSTASYVHFGGRIGVLVELSGAGGHEDAARDVAMHVAAANPVGVSPDDIPAGERERERQVLTEQAKLEGKPEAIVEKIVEGRMRKFYEQSSLLLQAFVKDSDVSVEQMLSREAEGLTVRRFVRFQIGE